VDEFLSIITRESSDPGDTRKLIAFVDAIESGQNLKKAAAGVSLDIEIAVRFLRSVKALLAAVVERGAAATASLPLAPEVPDVARGKKAGKLTAFTDGASRGNPGNAACAVIFFDDKNEELLRRSKKLGVTTNNVAEYEGVILALEFGGMLGAKELEIRLDSELVVKQLNKEYKVKHPSLKPLYERARVLLGAFRRVTITHILREGNKLADKLANDELDGKT
jgi:ribonuclease HI